VSVAQLQASLDAVDTQIAAFDHTRIAYSIDGRSFDGGKDFQSLLDRRAGLRQELINESGAVEVHTYPLG